MKPPNPPNGPLQLKIASVRAGLCLVEELIQKKQYFQDFSVVNAINDSFVSAYEKRIAKLEREKMLAEERIAKSGKARHSFEVSFEHAMRFLSSHCIIWRKSDLALRKTVLRLAFLEPLPHSRETGLRTPNLALPFKALVVLQQQM